MARGGDEDRPGALRVKTFPKIVMLEGPMQEGRKGGQKEEALMMILEKVDVACQSQPEAQWGLCLGLGRLVTSE